MKLLYGENLAPRLVAALADLYPASAHVGDIGDVGDVGLASATDAEVWAYAERLGFTVISKDSGLQQRSLERGHPPKVIWMRLGDCSTAMSSVCCVAGTTTSPGSQPTPRDRS